MGNEPQAQRRGSLKNGNRRGLFQGAAVRGADAVGHVVSVSSDAEPGAVPVPTVGKARGLGRQKGWSAPARPMAARASSREVRTLLAENRRR